MKSMAMGTGMARMRSARKMAAPLSTPTSSGLRPAYSRPIARPSSTIRAATSCREIRTRPGRSGTGASVGDDEGRDGHPRAHLLGETQGLVARARAAHAHPVTRLPVLGRHRALEYRKARLRELLVDAVGLLAAAKRAHLHAPARGRRSGRGDGGIGGPP